jgi:PST family polysaccharide transporter
MLTLLGREAGGKLLGLAGGVVLARWLDPSAFGLYAVALFAVGVLAFTTDIGLGVALIQSPSATSRREVDAVFTFMAAIVVTLGGVLFLAAPLVAGGYRTPELVAPLRALTAIFVLRSLRTVPVKLAERHLQYGRIALAESLGNVAYWLTAVAGALAGLGVWSLVVGQATLAVVDLVVVYAGTEWRPRWRFEWAPLRVHAGFSLLYKGQNAAELAKDMLIPALSGYAFGNAATGFLAWAQQLANAPRSLTLSVCRVSYPALRWLRDDRVVFVETAMTTLRWAYRIVLPGLAVLLALAPDIIRLVYGPKWLPALPALDLLLVDAALGIAAGVLLTMLYARGHVRGVLWLSLGATGGTWLLALAFVAGGAAPTWLAAAHALGTAATLVLAVAMLPDLPYRTIWRQTRRAVWSALGIGAALALAAPVVVHGRWSLASLAVIGGLTALTINVSDARSIALLRTLVLRAGRTERRLEPASREPR